MDSRDRNRAGARLGLSSLKSSDIVSCSSSSLFKQCLLLLLLLQRSLLSPALRQVRSAVDGSTDIQVSAGSPPSLCPKLDGQSFSRAVVPQSSRQLQFSAQRRLSVSPETFQTPQPLKLCSSRRKKSSAASTSSST